MSRVLPSDMQQVFSSLDPAVIESLADLVEQALIVAREIRLGRHVDTSIIRLDGIEAVVMYIIGDRAGAAPSQVAREACLQPSNLSVTLRSLEGKGMLDRRPHPADSRQVRLYPTPLAEENFRKVRAEWAFLVASELPAPHEGLAETVTTLCRLAQALLTRGR